MSYSRSHPSHRYHEMIELYRRLHREGERQLGLTAEQTYPGVSLLPHLTAIKRLINQTGAKTVLDYGCGKGGLYDLSPVEIPGAGMHDNVIDYWGIDELTLYDPCYERYSKLPAGKFDGVVSTDVLEHCMEDDIPWIVEEMFAYASRFLFANVASYAAKTTLPNGENAHCTVRPPAWWKAVFSAISARYPEVTYQLSIEQLKPQHPETGVP